MSDLSFVDSSNLDRLKTEIESMKRGKGANRNKPHKLILLLAVLDLADQGLLQENKIYLDGLLLRLFEENYVKLADSGDWCQPGPPFFHLRSASFWHHKVMPGREMAYSRLTTSGGGLKRISDNIEYAYLDEAAFRLISNSEARKELREVIMTLLEEESSSGNRRLKTAFHETFFLSRESIRQVLVAFDDHGDPSGPSSATEREKLLRRNTHLGTRYVKAMPRFAFGAGVVNIDYSTSPFGRAILNSDSLIENSDTLWLLHYFMSAPSGPGPLFWHEFVATYFRTGTEFAQHDVEAVIAECSHKDQGRILAKRTVNDTASVFLRTYTKDESLGNLKILEAISTTGRYRVLEPEPPSAWAFGYALLHFWRTLHGDVLTINLDSLHSEGGLGSIFLCGSGRVNRMLTTLQMEGFVDIYRVAPPFQVVLLRPDPEALLEKIYASFDTN